MFRTEILKLLDMRMRRQPKSSSTRRMTTGNKMGPRIEPWGHKVRLDKQIGKQTEKIRLGCPLKRSFSLKLFGNEAESIFLHILSIYLWLLQGLKPFSRIRSRSPGGLILAWNSPIRKPQPTLIRRNVVLPSEPRSALRPGTCRPFVHDLTYLAYTSNQKLAGEPSGLLIRSHAQAPRQQIPLGLEIATQDLILKSQQPLLGTEGLTGCLYIKLTLPLFPMFQILSTLIANPLYAQWQSWACFQKKTPTQQTPNKHNKRQLDFKISTLAPWYTQLFSIH